MAKKNVQFAIATHVAAILAYYANAGICTHSLAASVRAEPSFVRRVVARLAKAGILKTSRGQSGTCRLARAAENINLLEIYQAVAAPAATSMHDYPADGSCSVGSHIRDAMAQALDHAQRRFEHGLREQSLSQLVSAIRLHGCNTLTTYR